MRQLFSKKRGKTSTRATGPFVAVDFDRLTMRIVEARPGRGRCEIEKLVLVPMPDQLNLTDGAAVGAVLAKAMRDASIKVSTLVMAVPRAQAVLKPLTLPQSTDNGELAAMVLLQLDGQLPFPNEEAVIDFAAGARDETEAPKPASPANAVGTQKTVPAEDPAMQQMEVLAAAVQQQVVSRYSALAAAAGLKLAMLTLRPYANAACLTTLLPAPETTPESAEKAESEVADSAASVNRVHALVTLASDEVEVTVVADGHVIFSRSATLPSSATVPLDAALSQTLRALQSYQALHADRRVGAVYVAGAVGVEADLARRVGETFKVNASLLEPQRTMQLPDVISIGDKQGPLAFTSALGLALAFGSTDATLLPFDFINPKRPTAPNETSRTTRMLVALTILTGISCVFLLGYMTLGSKEREVARLAEELETLSKDTKRVTTLAKRLDLVETWTKRSVDPLAHWANLSALFPPAQDAFINALRTDNDGRLLFTARARNQQVVDTLTPKFNQSGYLSAPGSVATRGDSPDAPGYAFVTDVKITPSPKQKIDVATLTAPPRPADDVNQPPPPPKETATPGVVNNDPNKPRAEGAPSAAPATPGTPGAPGVDQHNPDASRAERWRKRNRTEGRPENRPENRPDGNKGGGQ